MVLGGFRSFHVLVLTLPKSGSYDHISCDHYNTFRAR